MLPYLYMRLKQDGNVATTFCGEHKTLEQFITYFDRLKTMQVLCTVNENNTVQPIGFSWLDNPRGVDGCRAAMPGFALFKGSSVWSRNVCRLGIAYWFHSLKIDILHGVQVASNIPARNFARRLGFKEVALIPEYHFVDGKLEAARIMSLKATDFMPDFWEWKKIHDIEDGEEIAVDGNE